MGACFDDLFAFLEGLCYLRLYRCDTEEPVAVAVELEDNPGVIGGAKELAARIAQVFGIRRFRLYVFSSLTPDWSEALMEAGDSGPSFRAVERTEIEDLVGESVAIPEPRDLTAGSVGGRGHPMLRFVRPKEPPRHPLDNMHVVAVAELPWAHNPSRCVHCDRFQTMRGLYQGSSGNNPAAGAHFFLSLSEDDFADCPYHRGDWVKIAAEAVALLGKMDPDSTHEEIYTEVSRRFPEEPERKWLLSLLIRPIIWDRPYTGIINGQHRICALKAAGAPFCPVRITGDPPKGLLAADPRRRAQSTLVQYWARQLGDELLSIPDHDQASRSDAES